MKQESRRVEWPGGWWLAFLVLSATFALLLFSGRSAGISNLSGPLPGESFPSLEVVELGPDPYRGPLAGILSAEHCSMVVFMSSGCGICRRMRWSWPANYARREAIGETPLRIIWISMDSEGQAELFFGAHDLRHIITVRALKPWTSRDAARFGMLGTPTSYVVGPSGRVLMGLIGDRFPPTDALVDVCSFEETG